MKNRFFPVVIAFCVVGVFSATVINAHEVQVHEQITVHAANSAFQFSEKYRQFLAEFAPRDQLLALNGAEKYPDEWMMFGSRREDSIVGQDNILLIPLGENPFGDAGGNRPYNHFYDPLSGEGLSDRGPKWLSAPAPLGRSAYIWAASDAPGLNVNKSPFVNVNTHNDWAWNRVRLYQELACTLTVKADRERNMAQIFRGLGNVVHLLQDASQPQHVRNEQHLDKVLGLYLSPFHSAFEKYGAKNVWKLPFTHATLDWKLAGFVKLRDFWDRDLYKWNTAEPEHRDATALIESEDEAKPTKKLGLAEFVNGNFIGDRHTYREIVRSGPFHYPFPSLFEGTDWLQLRKKPNAAAKPSAVFTDGQALRYIVAKTAHGRTTLPDGGKWLHHGAVDFVVAKYAATLPEQVRRASLNDPDVLKDYHDILIPEAVRYSAGLMDYFFRGKLETTLAANVSGGYNLTIQNVSGQDLKGGEFRLYWDDSFGNRTRLLSPGSATAGNFIVTQPDRVLDNGTISATFKPPTGVSVAKYTLVYKGTIGTKDGINAQDEVDVGLAIAAVSFDFNPLWWRMEEIVGDRIDSAHGVAMNGTDSYVHTVSSKAPLGNAAELAVAPANTFTWLYTAAIPELAFGAEGITIVGWANWDAMDLENAGTFALQYQTIVDGSTFSSFGFGATPPQPPLLGGGGFVFLQTGGVVQPVKVYDYFGALPTGWTFFRLWYEPQSEAARLEFNQDGQVFETSGTVSIPYADFGVLFVTLSTALNDPSATGSVAVDELGVFSRIITRSQGDFIYNGGVLLCREVSCGQDFMRPAK